jgi:hypothetical protein
MLGNTRLISLAAFGKLTSFQDISESRMTWNNSAGKIRVELSLYGSLLVTSLPMSAPIMSLTPSCIWWKWAVLNMKAGVLTSLFTGSTHTSPTV